MFQTSDYRYRRNLPYRPSSNLKFQTLHHMANLQKWQELLNTFYSFPNAVGMIDGTIHRINRPSNAEQAEFYRGDKRCHFMSTQLVVDADGLIVLLVKGGVNAHAFLLKYIIQSSYPAFNAIWLVICRFPGHMNDAQCYQIIGIGRGMGWDLPRRARLIADGDYAATVPLIVP